MTTKRHLLLIAIGPVQPFIAAARKIRDLWFGSDLLSEMSKTIARFLDAQRCTLIFPAPEKASDLDEHSALNVANKILAWCPDGVDAKALAGKAEEAWKKHYETTFEAVLKASSGLIDTTLFEQQRDDYGEFFAVWTPCPDESAYDKARQRVESLLAAAKMTRPFTPPAWTNGAGKPKNSLDGMRECVLVDADAGKTVQRQITKKGEHLDALGWVKRHLGLHPPAGKSISFDTLSAIAIAPYRTGICEKAKTDPSLAKAWADVACSMNNVLPASDQDQAFFEGYLDAWRKEYETDENAKSLRELNAAIAALHKQCGAPEPYACILHGDGDHMGAALSTLKKAESHQLFSQWLSKFALGVKSVIESHGGTLVYSGGDDVLAFLPLDQSVDCTFAVRTLFQQHMTSAAQAIKTQTRETITTMPTFSAGLAIAHHLEPLYRSLDAARRAEKLAKNTYGRNALAIVQTIRSGVELVVGGKWDGDQAFYPRIQALIELARKGVTPSRLAYQLRGVAQEFAYLGVKPPDFHLRGDDPMAKAYASEAKRIILHKDESSAPQDLYDRLCDAGSVRAFADELVVAQQIGRSRRVAAGEFS